MALKAYINGKDTGHIAFKGDHEPVRIYANGELVENISYISQEVTGNTSVDYKSEYKNNLLKMQVEGGTHQDEVNFVDATIDIPDSSGIWDIGSSLSSNVHSISTMNKLSAPAYPCKLRLKDYYDSDATYAFDYAVVSYNKQAIFDVYETGDFSELMTLYSGGGVVEDYYEIEVTQDFYLGIICDRNMTELGVPNYENAIGSAHLVATSQSPIQNSGDNGLECVVRGKNLCDLNYLTKNAYSAGGGYYSVKIYVGKGNRVTAFVNENFTEDKLGFYLGIAYGAGTTLANSSKSKWLYHSTVSALRARKVSFVSEEDYIYVSYSNKTSLLDNVEYLQVEIGKETPYEPYFAPTTLQIPQSVTLNGQEVALRFGRLSKTIGNESVNKVDCLLVDRLAHKVSYMQNTMQINALNANPRYKGTSPYATHVDCGLTAPKNAYIGTIYLVNGVGLCNNACWLYSLGELLEGQRGVLFEKNGQSITYYLPVSSGVTDTDSFKEWLANHETIVLYALKTPIEYDITDTELGQALLNLSELTIKDLTNVIEITSTPSVSSLTVEYAKWGGIE